MSTLYAPGPKQTCCQPVPICYGAQAAVSCLNLPEKHVPVLTELRHVPDEPALCVTYMLQHSQQSPGTWQFCQSAL